MTNNKIKCAKCGSEMEEGSLVEKSNMLGGLFTNENVVVNWGIFKPSAWWNSVKNKRQVTAHRCTSCGYLESYAK